jgi:uncharacterized protein YjbJ (UPF0337 family)
MPFYPDLCIVKMNSQIKLYKMNKTEVKGTWNEQKGKLKQKFAQLTDNDLLFEEGKKEEMMGRLQITLGKSKEELLAIISAL